MVSYVISVVCATHGYVLKPITNSNLSLFPAFLLGTPPLRVPIIVFNLQQIAFILPAMSSSWKIHFHIENYVLIRHPPLPSTVADWCYLNVPVLSHAPPICTTTNSHQTNPVHTDATPITAPTPPSPSPQDRMTSLQTILSKPTQSMSTLPHLIHLQ